MLENDTPQTELRELALNVKIFAYQENFETFAEEMNDLCAICILFIEQKISLDETLKIILHDTAEALLQHYPEDEKMLRKNFNFLVQVDPTLETLAIRYPCAMEHKMSV